MGAAIRFTLQNLPAILLVIAVIAATISRRGNFSSRLLDWVLLLPIGVVGLWGGIYHIFFPQTAASFIGWGASPFQYEVGVADIAFGATACLAFWRNVDFKTAAVMVASIELLGDAIGHVRQMISAHNFAPGNAGIIFYMDIGCPLLALLLLHLTQANPVHGRGIMSDKDE